MKGKTVRRLILYTLLTYCLCCILTPFNSLLLERSLKNQLSHLQEKFANGADVVLQERYPEGMTFANAIFALSLLNLIDSPILDNQQLSNQIEYSLKQLQSQTNRDNFQDNLTLPYGAFYQGWTNYVIKQYLDSPLSKHSADQSGLMEDHQKTCQLFEEKFTDSQSLFETYHGSIWPADNLVCIASLPDSSAFRQMWLDTILKTSTTPTGLIHHIQEDTHHARGSSQSLILYFLHDIDHELAKKHYTIFQDSFVHPVLSVQFVKEGDEMDIDSGPILFGVGSVATIMHMITQERYQAVSKSTMALFNLLGIPIHWGSKKYYLFEQEMMFDLFMFWTLSTLYMHNSH